MVQWGSICKAFSTPGRVDLRHNVTLHGNIYLQCLKHCGMNTVPNMRKLPIPTVSLYITLQPIVMSAITEVVYDAYLTMRNNRKNCLCNKQLWYKNNCTFVHQTFHLSCITQVTNGIHSLNKRASREPKIFVNSDDSNWKPNAVSKDHRHKPLSTGILHTHKFTICTENAWKWNTNWICHNMSLDQSPAREFGLRKTGTVSNVGPLLLIIILHSLSVWTTIRFYAIGSVLSKWPVHKPNQLTTHFINSNHYNDWLPEIWSTSSYHDNLWMGHTLL